MESKQRGKKERRGGGKRIERQRKEEKKKTRRTKLKIHTKKQLRKTTKGSKEQNPNGENIGRRHIGSF